jgi:glutamate synthase (ferredoxin)
MTRGQVVVIGPVGRNFAAGMSGGVAFVLDETGVFPGLCNPESVDLEAVTDAEDIHNLRQLIEEHVKYTGSERGRYVLERWSDMLPKFVKVMPVEYRRALQAMAAQERAQTNGANGHAEPVISTSISTD